MAHFNMQEFCFESFHTGTRLHTAAVNGDKIGLEKLLKHQADHDTLNQGDRYGRTALVYTVFGDWFDCAEVLVRHGASISQTDSDKRTILHWAAYLGRTKFIKLFLKHLDPGVDYHCGDKDGRTALHYAAMQPNSKCLRALMRMNYNKKMINITDKDQMTALQWSVFYNRLENMKVLLKEGADSTKRDSQGRCLLHLAVLNPNAYSLRIVRILLKLNRHYSRQIDCNKRTSLHLAVANDNDELVRELSHAEESPVNDLDGHSRSVLHYAVLKKDVEQTKMLMSIGVLVHHADDTGATVLHYAAKDDNVMIVKCLLSKFTSLEDMPDNEGRTALIWAAGQGSKNVLEFMLNHLEYFNVHASDEQGLTALHFACIAGHKECVQLLVANSADTSQPDKLGQTALFKACQQGHKEIIDILMRRDAQQLSTIKENFSHSERSSCDLIGRNTNQRWSKAKKEKNENRLFSIEEETAASNYMENSEWTTELTDTSMHEILVVENLLSTPRPTGNHTELIGTEMGNDSETLIPGINTLEDDNGCTPLHFAAHAGHVSVCKWLLSQQVDPGKKDAKGRTALHGAAFNGHAECMSHILSHNPNLANDCDVDGYSALHHAAINGQLEAVKMLVLKPYNAVLNYRVKSTDWTPLDFAMAADHQDVTQFLMDNGALTIAWLQDVAADRIKKFLRDVATRKREAMVLSLLAKHEQLQREEKVRHKSLETETNIVRETDADGGGTDNEPQLEGTKCDQMTNCNSTSDNIKDHVRDQVTAIAIITENDVAKKRNQTKRDFTKDSDANVTASRRDDEGPGDETQQDAETLNVLKDVKDSVTFMPQVHDIGINSKSTSLDNAGRHDSVSQVTIRQFDEAARMIQKKFRTWLQVKRRTLPIEDYTDASVSTKKFHSHKAMNTDRFISASKRDDIGTPSTFTQSNLANLSRAPDCVIEASAEKDKIYEIRESWQRIALLRRKKKAALVLQKHLRGHLQKRNKHENITSKTEITQDERLSRSDEERKQRKVMSNTPSSSNVATYSQRLTRDSVETRLRANVSEEKLHCRSTFPLLSPKSSSRSSSQSPSNRNIVRRVSQSHRSIGYETSLSTNKRAPQSRGNRRVDVAPAMNKNDLVNLWLSEKTTYDRSQDTAELNHSESIHAVSNPEFSRRKIDPSKSSRRASVQSARTQRNEIIKNVYGSPAATSFNFALDTYHPLASRRGRRDSAVLFGNSSRVRPHSMKRSEEGWVRTLENHQKST